MQEGEAKDGGKFKENGEWQLFVGPETKKKKLRELFTQKYTQQTGSLEAPESHKLFALGKLINEECC